MLVNHYSYHNQTQDATLLHWNGWSFILLHVVVIRCDYEKATCCWLISRLKKKMPLARVILNLSRAWSLFRFGGEAGTKIVHHIIGPCVDWFEILKLLLLCLCYLSWTKSHIFLKGTLYFVVPTQIVSYTINQCLYHSSYLMLSAWFPPDLFFPSFWIAENYLLTKR